MRRFTTASLALTIAATGFLTSAALVAAQDEEPLKIGLVTDVGQLEDKSFNEFTYAGMLDAAEALGAETDVIITEEVADYKDNMQAFVNEGYDIIVTPGSLIGTATYEMALENPDVYFVGIDQDTSTEETPNFQGVVFREDEAGYLAGIVAATITESDVIGAVGGTMLPAVVRYIDGYINGARSVNPDVEVLSQEASPQPEIGFNTPDLGGEIASQMIDLGADVIFQVAGGTGVGVLEATCQAGSYGIGVDVDQTLSLPPQAAECVVTSAEKKLQDTTSSVIQSIADGTFEGGVKTYDVSSDPPAIALSTFQETYADLLTPELQAALDAAIAGFIDGSIDPGATPE
jgi:basic membrane protein A